MKSTGNNAVDSASTDSSSSSSTCTRDGLSYSVSSARRQWQERVDTNLALSEAERYERTNRDLGRKESEGRRAAIRLEEEQLKKTKEQTEHDELLAKALVDSPTEIAKKQQMSDEEIARRLAAEEEDREHEDEQLNSDNRIMSHEGMADTDVESRRLAEQLQAEEDNALAQRLQEATISERNTVDPESDDYKDLMLAMQLQAEQDAVLKQHQDDESYAKMLMEQERSTAESNRCDNSPGPVSRAPPQSEPVRGRQKISYPPQQIITQQPLQYPSQSTRHSRYPCMYVSCDMHICV
eukprot:GHVQ01017996.1.p1 GENE.GHVQ01017996.1~~GHVQ01017996.1.p1  ORF type:complete len:295 (+),score=69.08 GHVQ01017996.1:222-1106(+)